MPTRERPSERGRRRCRAQVASIATDGRNARVGAGLSQKEVGAAVGCSHSRVGRFERGDTRDPSLEFLSAYCAIVGLDLSLRAYPGGDAFRDAAQLALLERFRARLGPGLRWRAEVPLPVDGDLRAWDGEVRGRGWRCRLEAETRMTDVQALQRRIALKARDDPGGHVILVLADTRHNRDTLAAVRETLRGFLPLDTRELLRALGEGREPRASGIVIL